MATDYVPTEKKTSFVSFEIYPNPLSRNVQHTNFVAWCYQGSRWRSSHTLPPFWTCRSAPLPRHVWHCDLPRQPSQSRSPGSSL